MRPNPAIAFTDRLPELTTTVGLAEWLEISVSELDWFAGRHQQEERVKSEKLRHYRYRWMKRRGRRPRLIEAPKPRLKSLQRIILDELLYHVPIHPAAGAFRKVVSIVDCIQPHAGQRIVLRMDLCDFFPSIRVSRVMALFRTVGYPESVARYLAALCTNAAPRPVVSQQISRLREPDRWHRFCVDHLPQGAPTSPALANLCAFRLDRRLCGLARKFDANYTRYADDLLFSGGDELARSQSRFRTWALAVLLDERFAIQDRKTRSMLHGGKQHALGLTVNERPNVSRREFDRLKAMLFNCGRFGPESQNHDAHPRFREHLRGRISWFTQINRARGAKLRKLFDRIEWE
jgi:RNA-directed DNA polymerase